MTHLRTQRLTLVPLGSADVDSLQALFNDPDVGRYLLDGAAISREWVEEEVRQSQQRFADGGAGLWTIRVRRDGGAVAPAGGHDDDLVGIVGYRPFFDPPELQLLYALKPGLWGRGLATEAADAALRYAFDVLELDEVRAATDAPNAGSIDVLERLGMTLWKTEPGRPWDTLFYRIPSSSGT